MGYVSYLRPPCRRNKNRVASQVVFLRNAVRTRVNSRPRVRGRQSRVFCVPRPRPTIVSVDHSHQPRPQYLAAEYQPFLSDKPPTCRQRTPKGLGARVLFASRATAVDAGDAAALRVLLAHAFLIARNVSWIFGVGGYGTMPLPQPLNLAVAAPAMYFA